MERCHLHLTEKQIEILRGLSKDTGLKIAELARRAIDEFIERQIDEYYKRRNMAQAERPNQET